MTYTFLTDKIEIRNIDKKYKVRGYATLLGNKIDLKNSIITDSAKQKMLDLIKTYDVAVDVEHDAVATARPNLLPVAKVRGGEFDAKGLIVDIELNPHSPQFRTTWNSLKGGFLDALSVEFIPKHVSEQFIDGQWVKVIDDLTLNGLAFTGRSATVGTNILEVMCCSINEFPNERIDTRNAEAKMENKKQEEVKTEEPKKEEKVEEKIIEKEIIKEVIPEDVKKEIEELKKENTDLKEDKDKETKKEEKEKVDAQSVVKQEDKYAEPVVAANEKPIEEKLDEQPLKELMKEAIEKEAYKK